MAEGAKIGQGVCTDQYGWYSHTYVEKGIFLRICVVQETVWKGKVNLPLQPYPHTDSSRPLIQNEPISPLHSNQACLPCQLAPEHPRQAFSHPSHPFYLLITALGFRISPKLLRLIQPPTHSLCSENLTWYQSQVHQNLVPASAQAQAHSHAFSSQEEASWSSRLFNLFKKKMCSSMVSRSCPWSFYTPSCPPGREKAIGSMSKPFPFTVQEETFQGGRFQLVTGVATQT
ncbi:hypothetical protein F2Q69_00013350 [Brassica cretica]|uniref:Uncharacterized protein n=1 Tax=Brassica cretica TaxID=69181 RepID=A0A8S9R6H1_BRACR|nr:hypothetical protein F2Q69_00013350 [Brassica cretica]